MAKGKIKGSRSHRFEFPGETGEFFIELKNGCFPDIDTDELYEVGKILSSFLYGFLIETREVRESYLNTFHSILRDITIFIEDKDLTTLLRFASMQFKEGDFENSLFISKLVLARINKIVDDKIAQNSLTIDKEIIRLQISTLNFIGYLYSKLHRNLDYGLKLTNLANSLLNEFDQDNKETIALKSAIHDTLGVLYILKERWDKAVSNLDTAHEYDEKLRSLGQTDVIGLRLTNSNLGYAIVRRCDSMLADGSKKINFHEIETELERAARFFMKVKVDVQPVVPEELLKDRELSYALKRMQEGVSLHTDVKRKLQKRLI
jgi:tetratricopeptide (TPR) repeat protein